MTEQFETARFLKLSFGDKKVIETILDTYGFIKMKQPRKANGKKYTVAELDKITTKAERDKGVFIRIANHDTCVVGNYIEDIWDCGYKTIGNYWIKKG